MRSTGFVRIRRLHGLSSTRAVQAMHRPLEAAGKQIREYALRPDNGLFDGQCIVPGRSSEHIVHNLPRIARMIDPDAQTPEYTPPQGAHDIPKTIVPRMTASLLEADGTRGKIQFIVRHQQLFLGNPEVTRKAGDRLTTAVHVGGWLEQPAFMAVDMNPAGLSMKSGFVPENASVAPGQQIDEPETRVMTGLAVLPARITQTDDETDWGRHVRLGTNETERESRS